MMKDKTIKKKQRWKYMKNKQLQVVNLQFVPTETDYDDHVWTMNIEEVRLIAALRTGLDCSEDQVPNEMVSAPFWDKSESPNIIDL